MSFLRLLLCLLVCAAPGRAEPARVMDRAALLEAIAGELSARHALTEVLSVDLLRPWSPPPAAADDAAPVVLTLLDSPEALASSLLVRVRFTQGGRILREDTLALRASLWREGLVAVVPLGRGEALSMQGVESRRFDALRERDALPLSAVGEDYSLARQIPAGHPLVWRDVVRRALVKRGGMVEVSAGEGSLLITMKALAMQDGARGEVVRVRNLDSKREFTALVTAENRAEVRF